MKQGSIKQAGDCLDAFWDDEAASVPLPPHLTADDLGAAERIAYRLINHAAETGRPCPVNIDIEVAAGFNSSSMGPKLGVDPGQSVSAVSAGRDCGDRETDCASSFDAW